MHDGNYFLPEKFHELTDSKTNSFLLDPEYIKVNYDSSFYKQNPDGSIDIELTLYFKPNSYFYVGILISLATFFLCVGYLVWDWRKNK